MSRAMRGMIAPRSVRRDAAAFFKSVLERRFSEAERAIDAIRERRFGGGEFKAGYINALEGILLSIRSGDERDFINRAPLDAESMEDHLRRFGELSKESVDAPFDAGYFSAWADFMRYRLRLRGDG